MRNMNQNQGNCSGKCNSMPNNRNSSCGKCNTMQGSMNNSCNSCNSVQPNIINSCGRCNCEDNSTMCMDPLRGMPVGIGYVPWQEWGCVYDYAEGLSRGTIFPPLDLPFYGCIPRGFQTDKGGNA